MSEVRQAASVAIADLRDRLRSRRLLVVLLGAVYVGYLVNTGQFEPVFQADVDRPPGYVSYFGVRTAAYVGLGAAMVITFVLLFGGYYLVKGRVAHDHATNVDEIVATTPVTNTEYLLGKWASGVSVLGVVLGVLWVAAVVNHAIYGVGPLRPLQVLLPIVVLGLPTAGLVAGVAVAFETNRWLDGTVGNVAYFCLVIAALAVTLDFGSVAPSALSVPAKVLDITGRFAVHDATFDAISRLDPDYRGSGLGLSARESTTGSPRTFRITTVTFAPWVYATRLGFVVAGAAIAAGGAVTVDRWASTEQTDGLLARLWTRVISSSDTAPERDAGGERSEDIALEALSETSVTDRTASGLASLFALELRAALRGRRWWWYFGSAVLCIAGIMSALGWALPRRALLPAALVWPVFVWSGLGSRARRYRTRPLILSAPNVYRQLLATWLAGVVITVVLVGPASLGTLEVRSVTAVLSMAGVAVSIPSFALFVGVLTGSGRAFEGVYLPLWYLSLNGVLAADFAGLGSASLRAGIPLFYGLLGLGLVAVAGYHRYRATV